MLPSEFCSGRKSSERTIFIFITQSILFRCQVRDGSRGGFCLFLVLLTSSLFLFLVFFDLDFRQTGILVFGLVFEDFRDTRQTDIKSVQEKFTAGSQTYLFLLANFPILPIFRIIILALLTVDDKLMLSVDMFFILNRPFFFSFGSPGRPASVLVVLSVSANETSLLMADGLARANGADGGFNGTSVGS
jgi:hypothetical protein